MDLTTMRNKLDSGAEEDKDKEKGRFLLDSSDDLKAVKETKATAKKKSDPDRAERRWSKRSTRLLPF